MVLKSNFALPTHTLSLRYVGNINNAGHYLYLTNLHKQPIFHKMLANLDYVSLQSTAQNLPEIAMTFYFCRTLVFKAICCF